MNLIFPEDACLPSARHFAMPVGLYLKPRDGQQDRSNATAPAHVPDPSVVRHIRQRIENSGAFAFAEEDLQTAGDSKSHTQRLTALHSALSILCHVAATDKSSHFISRQPIQPPKPSGAGKTSSREDSFTPFLFLTDVYTTVRALRLEYEDVLQQENGGNGSQLIDTHSLNANCVALEHRIDECLMLLESTILRMVVNLNRARQISPRYIEGILRMLPQVFAVEKWPCALLQKEKDRRSPQAHTRVVGNGDIFHGVGDAATSIVLRALQEIRSSDCLRLLSHANLTKKERSGDAPPLLSFDALMARALSGVYSWRGLYGALYDMRVLLYGVYARVPPEQDAVVTGLRLQFENSLRRYYAEFLEKTGIYSHVVEGKEALLPEKTIFDANPPPKEEDVTSYSETQIKCLKLLDLLRAVDVNGWFEYPVFDMANIELSSVEKWVRSVSFSLKTNRDAFTAIRHVLETMVDNCVLSHGPTSPFSRAITMVRQRLVDAAREVGLLRS